MSRVDAHRMVALLQKATERLQLLTLLDVETAVSGAKDTGLAGGSAAATLTSAGGATIHADGTVATTANGLPVLATAASAAAAGGVGAILEAQRALESRYDALVAAAKLHSTAKNGSVAGGAASMRSTMGGAAGEPALDPLVYAHVQDPAEASRLQELREVAAALKQHSKLLCRLLKDNPCDADNWRKVVAERTELLTTLLMCAKELAVSGAPPGPVPAPGANSSSASATAAAAPLPGTFENFARKILEEQAGALWADELVRKERETNQNVKQLQNEVKAERAAKEVELGKRHEVIARLKAELTALKQDARTQLERLRAETDASSEAQQRAAANFQRELQERVNRLRAMVEDEKRLSATVKDHARERADGIRTLTDDWRARIDTAKMDIERDKANRERTAADLTGKLRDVQSGYDLATVQKRAREEDKARAEDEKRRKEGEKNAKYAAATKLQAAVKGYFTRQFLITFKKKALKRKPVDASAAQAAAPKKK
jgi:hypothetical protein